MAMGMGGMGGPGGGMMRGFRKDRSVVEHKLGEGGWYAAYSAMPGRSGA